MQNTINQIYNVDNIEFLNTLGTCSVDNICTDVPYALCDIDALKMIKEGVNNKGDFMNKKWFLPTVDFLKECHRVLKDGSFFITTFSPRQDLQCVFSYRLLEAGFDINFTPLLWCYASGFPKAMDFGRTAQKRSGIEPEIVGEKLTPSTLTKRQIDGKRNNNTGFDSGGGSHIMQITKPTTPEAQYLSGLKSLQLKPAYEVVMIAQKPYKEKSKIDQALVWYNERKDLLDKDIKEEDLYLYTRNASGGVRIDKNEMFDGVMSSRIPIENIESENGWSNVESYNKSIYTNFNVKREAHNEGRFPATILTGSPIDFDGQDILELHTTQTTSPVLFELLDYIGLTLDDFKTLSAEELQGIIARLKKPLDVGRERKGGGAIKDCDKTIFNNYTGKISNPAQDSGDLSRYFSLDAWTKKNLPELYKISKKTLELQEDAEKISPFLFTSKPDKGTKNAGLEEFETKEKWLKSGGGVGISERQTMAQNTHPTGKSIALYSYLINLFTHPHDLVLDPYCGSGTTPIACVLTNRHYIGLELEKEYFDIAEARVKHWEGQLNIQKQHVISTQTTQENANLFEDNV